MCVLDRDFCALPSVLLSWTKSWYSRMMAISILVLTCFGRQCLEISLESRWKHFCFYLSTLPEVFQDVKCSTSSISKAATVYSNLPTGHWRVVRCLSWSPGICTAPGLSRAERRLSDVKSSLQKWFNREFCLSDIVESTLKLARWGMLLSPFCPMTTNPKGSVTCLIN